MRRVIPILAGVLCAVCLFGVLFPMTHEPAEALPYRVAAIMRAEDDSFWRRVWNGIRAESSVLGMEISEYQYDETDRVADYLEICYHAGVDAVIIGILNPSVLEDSASLVEQMRREGILIAAVDVELGGTLSDVYIGLDNYALGRQMVEHAVPDRERVENIAVFIARSASDAHKLRLAGCIDRLEEYGLADVVDLVELSGEYIEQLSDIQDYITGLDGPSAVITIHPARTIDVANIVSRNGLTDVIIVGLGETEEALNLVGDGTVQALMMQDNYGMGVSAVRAVYEYFEDPSALDPWVTVDTVVVTEENWADVLPEVLETPN